MAFLRFSRDKRGYEHFYLIQPTTSRRGKSRGRLVYFFRTPPNVKVGRQPFDDEARRAIEGKFPDVVFDWPKLLDIQIPPPDLEKWRERRRMERAAKQAAREEEDQEVQEVQGVQEVRGVPEVPEALEVPVAGLLEVSGGAEVSGIPEVLAGSDIVGPEGVPGPPPEPSAEPAGPTGSSLGASEVPAPGRRRRRRRRRGRGRPPITTMAQTTSGQTAESAEIEPESAGAAGDAPGDEPEEPEV